MANEIDLVVGSVAFKQITDLLVELGKVDGEIKKIGESAIKMNTALGVKNTADLTKLSAENAKLNKEIEKLIGSAAILETKLANATTAQAKSTKATTDALIAEEKLIAAKQKNADTTEKNANKEVKASQTRSKYITQETIDIRLKNKELAQEYTELSKNAGAYDKHDAQYRQMAKSLKDLAFQGKEGTKDFIEKEKALTALGNRLKSVDAITGSHTRNVGNYASSWNGLGNSINQLTREAPAFANSLQTGFMALSNNIPILTDELGVLIDKNKKLKADGKPTESILKTVAGAFFSWQTAISLGVTILTVYGAKLFELAKAAYESNKGISATVKAQESLNTAISEGNKNAAEEVGHFRTLYATATNVALSQKERNDATNEMQKLYPKVLENIKDETIQNGKAKDSYYLIRDAIIAKSRAAAISSELDKLAAEEFAKEAELRLKLDLEMNELYRRKDALADIEWSDNVSAAQIKRVEAQYNNQVKVVKDINKQILNLNKDLNKEQDILLKARQKQDEKAAIIIPPPKEEKAGKDKTTEDAAKAKEEILKKDYETRLSNLQRLKEIDSDDLEFSERVIEEKVILSAALAADEILIAEAVFEEKKRLAKGDVQLIRQAINEKKTAEENAQEENLKRVTKYYEEQEKKATEYAKKLSEFNILDSKEYKKYLEDKKKEDEDRKKYLEKTLDELKNYSESFVSEFASNLGFKETFDFFVKVDSEGKTMWEKLDQDGVSGQEKFKARFNAIAESSQEMFNMIAQMSATNYEQEYARLDKQKETSLKFAGDSTAAKEKIEADYEKKKKEIDKRKFEADKKISMVNIAIDTAQAVVATLPNIPLSIIIGAMGAVQLAMVASQQFPAYAEGTDNHKGGLMLVNDGAGSNFQEKVILPSGKVIRPQGRNVLMDAPKGTKVLNHEQQLFEMLQSNNISMSNPQYQGMTPDEMDEILGKHFGNIKTQNTIFDKNGFQSYVKNGNSITRSNSNRSQAIGISV